MTVEVIQDVPEGVIHLRIGEGKLTESDYDDVIEPAIESAVAEGSDHVRMLVDVDRIPSMQVSAIGDDFALAWKHRHEWDRIATIGDSDAVRRLSSWFSPLTPGKVKGFRAEQRDDAIAWLTEPSSN